MTRLIPLSLLIWFLALVLRPNHATCPPQTWLDEGVRSNGVYECAPLPPAQWRRGPRGGWVDQSRDAAWSVEGEVYCTGGQVAITVDGRTVGCEARH